MAQVYIMVSETKLVCPDKQVRRYATYTLFIVNSDNLCTLDVKAYCRGAFTARNSTHGALNKQTVIVVAPLICIVAMASEITNHLRGAANKYCHICEVLCCCIDI